MVMLDCNLILPSAKVVWVVLGGLGCRWEVVLYCRAILASV